MTARLVVVGGGLAGLSAAMRLAEAGLQPLLLETRKRLGGRATSLTDPRHDVEIDNCQHVVLGCCTNLLDLYERLNVLDQIEWHETLHWTAGHGIIESTRPGRLPAPFHLATSFRRLKFLSRDSRRAIARAMWRLIRMGPSGRLRWRGRSFAEALGEWKQSPEAVQRFWNVIITSACNVPCERVDASYAMQVFQQGFLSHRFGSAVGLSRMPLAHLYKPAMDFVESRGGDVVTGVSVRSLPFDGRRVTGVVTPDGMIPATTVVSAVPFDRLDRLVSDTMRRADPRLQRLEALEVSPILGVHLWFDRAVMDLPHLILVDAGVQWLFNKGVDAQGRQHLHAVISAAYAWIDLDEETIVERVMGDIHGALPGSRGLLPVASRSIKEKQATFACVPGVDALRPRAASGTIGLGGGGIPNLVLAGDWCDTGWPATMEGAVRSGYAAAGAIIGDDLLAPDLPTSTLARWLGLRQH